MTLGGGSGSGVEISLPRRKIYYNSFWGPWVLLICNKTKRILGFGNIAAAVT